MHQELDIFKRLAEKLLQVENEQPVAPYIPEGELMSKLDLDLQEQGIDDSQLEQLLTEIVQYTPKTSSSAFFNQLFGGRHPKATLGELLAVMLNNSMYTYKVGGPQVGIEKNILDAVCQSIGFGEQSDGTFPPGGSMSNLMALIMARDAKTDTKKHGVTQTMTMYTSAESHYSNIKNASFAGIGREQVRYIAVDGEGKLESQALEKTIQEDLENNCLPFMVCATAGTTVLGVFDPIEEIADICERYNIWLHVDGAYLGAVLFSDKYKHLLNGVDRADSFSFNSHKILNTPLITSILVTKDKKHLHQSFSTDADYLYQTSGDDFNLGKTSLQCGRRNDALKFWTLWKAVGTKGLGEMVDHEFHLADTARNHVEEHPDYTLYSGEETIAVCFNYKGIPANELCNALYEHNELMVGFGNFDGTEFIRLVLVNSQCSEKDVLDFFDTLEAFVENHPSLFEKYLESAR